MTIGLLASCGGYGQLGFIGVNGWVIADASTLTVVASGATSEQIVDSCACAMVGAGTMIGVSSPNVGGEENFGFLVQNGAFSTFALPSDFAYLTNTNVLWNFTSVNVNLTPETCWAQAWVSVDSYNYFLPLGAIAGLTSGSTTILPGYNINTYALPGAFLSEQYLYWLWAGNATYIYYININSSGAPTRISLPSTPINAPGTYNSCNLGAYIAYLDTNNNVYICDWTGAEYAGLTSTNYTSWGQISGAGLLLFNYQGANLFIVNPETELACSFNIPSKTLSPIFSFAIDASKTTPAAIGYEQNLGVLFLQEGNGNVNFGNLSPMGS